MTLSLLRLTSCTWGTGLSGFSHWEPLGHSRAIKRIHMRKIMKKSDSKVKFHTTTLTPWYCYRCVHITWTAGAPLFHALVGCTPCISWAMLWVRRGLRKVIWSLLQAPKSHHYQEEGPWGSDNGKDLCWRVCHWVQIVCHISMVGESSLGVLLFISDHAMTSYYSLFNTIVLIGMMEYHFPPKFCLVIAHLQPGWSDWSVHTNLATPSI